LQTGDNRVYWYLGAVLAVVALFAIVVDLADLQTSWLRLGVLTPSILALVFVSFFDRNGQSPFFLQFLLDGRSLLWVMLSIALFPMLAWLAGLTGNLFFDSPLRMGHLPQVNTILLVFFLALGEEIGWRGYALPRLVEQFGWIRASLILGIVWWLWHTPGWLLGFGAPTDLSFLVFGLWVVSASFLFTWAYLKSGGNVWTAVFLHASANLSFQVFPIMPGAAGGPENFYILCAISVLAAALLILFSRDNSNLAAWSA